MRKILLALGVLVGLTAAAHADTTTTNFKFILPSTGSLSWGLKVNDWMVKADTGVAGIGLKNTFTQSQTISGGGITATTGTFTAGLTASSGTFLNTSGAGIQTSSGILVNGGMFNNQGGGGDLVKYGIVAATGTFSGLVSVGTITATTGVTAASGTFTNGVDVSSLTTHATGASQFAISLSTSITFPQSGGTGMGIRWADGTISTTAAAASGGGGGSGDVTQAGNNAFTGNNTHAGLETMTAPSTITVLGSSNFSILVSSYDFSSNVSTITILASDFSGSDFSSASWRIHFALVSGSAIHYMLYFGGTGTTDLGAPGSWVYKTNNLQSGGGVSGAALTNKGCVLDDTAGGIQVAASAGFVGDFSFETMIGFNGVILGTSSARFSSNSTPTTPARSITDCYRSGSTGAPTSIYISFNTLSDSTAVPNT